MALKQIPALINDFNLYYRGNKLIGNTGEVTLPNLEAMTATVAGGGVLGEVDMPVIGRFGSITMEIPFRAVGDEMYELADPTQSVELTLRGSIQTQDPGSLDVDSYGMRIIIRGLPKALNNGNANKGNPMDSSVTIELSYYKVEVDGKERVELDKINYVYKINGKDKLAKIRKQT